MINVRSSKSLESYIDREVQAIVKTNKKDVQKEPKSQSVKKEREEREPERLESSRTITKFELP